jgi:hypothetical protein
VHLDLPLSAGGCAAICHCCIHGHLGGVRLEDG